MNVRRLYFACSLFLITAEIASGILEITPTMDQPIRGSDSVLYCPALQVAWNNLTNIIGGPIQMQKQDPLVEQLNTNQCPSNVIPESAHVSMAGFINRGIITELEKALKTRFGANSPTLPSVFSDKDTVLITYSHLQRTLPFPKKFIRSTDKTAPLQFHHEQGITDVHFFGSTGSAADKYAGQVQILQYSGPDNFAIRLQSQIEDEFIVLSKMDKPSSLLNAVTQTSQYLRPKGTENSRTDAVFLSHGDTLIIPIISLTVATNFPQLCHRPLQNKGLENVWLEQVYQDIFFQMDESGAIVKSTAYAAAACLGTPPQSKPRQFVFNKPFLLTLWKKNAPQPYLAIWVASPDILIPFKKATNTAVNISPTPPMQCKGAFPNTNGLLTFTINFTNDSKTYFLKVGETANGFTLSRWEEIPYHGIKKPFIYQLTFTRSNETFTICEKPIWPE